RSARLPVQPVRAGAQLSVAAARARTATILERAVLFPGAERDRVFGHAPNGSARLLAAARRRAGSRDRAAVVAHGDGDAQLRRRVRADPARDPRRPNGSRARRLSVRVRERAHVAARAPATPAAVLHAAGAVRARASLRG